VPVEAAGMPIACGAKAALIGREVSFSKHKAKTLLAKMFGWMLIW